MKISERWTRLMANMGMSENTDAFDSLIRAYSEGHRKYHNTDHIKTVLTELDRHEELTNNKNELELALWFHDAVYKPLSSSNEEKSAAWVQEFMQRNNLNEQSTHQVIQLINATGHIDNIKRSDEKLISDIDIAIFGQPQEIYESYAEAVRTEYRIVPSVVYRRKRRALLDKFLKRSRLYATKEFFYRYEKQARFNLNREITSL